MALAAACAWVGLGATSATGAVYFVDGACPSSGSGTSLACGPVGPFRTIAEGILAMAAGDTLNIRGPHETFDGVYFEQLSLRDGAATPGQALACSLPRPCVIQGCRAPACSTDEEPIVRGMTLRDDWVAQGNGVHRRVMEPTPEPDGLERDLFDPHILMQATGTPMTMLAYAGDGDTTPLEGQWSYDPATHAVFVNPAGGADPATTIFVPHFSFNAAIEHPSANVTLDHLTLEGTRGRSIDASGTPALQIPGLTLRHLTQRYVPRYFILTHDAPGMLIEGNLAEEGCRGMSWAQSSGDGCFGYRVFGADNSIFRRNIVRHLGSAGRRRLSAPGGGTGWPCPWCDPPWNDAAHTDVSAYGVCINIKQTEGAVLEENQCEDLSLGGIFLDVSRRVTVQRNRIGRTRSGIDMRNFTPTDGCPNPDPRFFCFNSDHVIRSNVIDACGLGDINGCAVNIIAGGEHHTGAIMTAEVYNNMVSHPGFAGICVQNGFGTTGGSSTATSDVSIVNNTVYGAPLFPGVEPSQGIVVRDATDNVVIRNNLLDGLTGDGLVLAAAALPSPPALAGLSLDGEVLGAVAPGNCEVRWAVPPFAFTPAGGTCDTLAGFRLAALPNEQNGSTGSIRFADVNVLPPDLHLAAGSAAIDAGVPLVAPLGALLDFDGNTRPQGAGWDAGADEFGGPVVTTTSTTSATVPTTTSTTSSTSTTTSTTNTTTSTMMTTSSTTSTSTSTSTSLTTSSTTSSTSPSPSTSTSSTTAPSTSPSSTSTSTSVAAPTTTSTLPPVSTPALVIRRLSGKTLLLEAKAKNEGSQRFRVVSADREQLTLGDVADLRALIAQGGSLRITAIGGDGFAEIYPLDAASWRVIDRKHPDRGVRYGKPVGPITQVRLEAGKRLLLQGRGPELEQSLGQEPTVIEVELRIGPRVYCLAFGGEERQFARNKKLRRIRSARPATCPAV